MLAAKNSWKRTLALSHAAATRMGTGRAGEGRGARLEFDTRPLLNLHFYEADSMRDPKIWAKIKEGALSSRRLVVVTLTSMTSDRAGGVVGSLATPGVVGSAVEGVVPFMFLF